MHANYKFLGKAKKIPVYTYKDYSENLLETHKEILTEHFPSIKVEDFRISHLDTVAQLLKYYGKCEWYSFHPEGKFEWNEVGRGPTDEKFMGHRLYIRENENGEKYLMDLKSGYSRDEVMYIFPKEMKKFVKFLKN